MSVATSASTQQRGGITRAQIIELGRAASNSWNFIPLALRALALEPRDDVIRFLLSSAFARLGLRTPACEHLARIAPENAIDPATVALADEVHRLPDDRIRITDLERICRANLDALASRPSDPVDLRPHVERWLAHAASLEWFRTTDGQVITRTRGQPDAWTPHRLADHRTQAEAAQLPANSPAPFYLEGIDPPWLFVRISRDSPRASDGHQPRIFLLAADVMEFLDGLAQTDLSEHLRSNRLLAYIGSDAARRFREHLARPEILDLRLAGPVVTLPTVRTRLDPPPTQILDEAAESQNAHCLHLRALVAAEYAAKPASHLTERLRNRTGLRVLIPVSRYSTFIRHSAADLAAALESLGCRRHILTEPDDHSHLAEPAYLRALSEFRPDVVVLINHTRADLGGIIPAQIPVISWVQDAMPHLFRSGSGSTIGPRDLVAGHLHPSFLQRCGYPRERLFYTPVVASGTKFHAGPVDPGLLKRFECEIAYVGNQSETAAACRDRLIREAASGPGGMPRHRAEALFHAIHDHALNLADGPPEKIAFDGLYAATRTAIEAITGQPATAEAVTLFTNSATLPIADRAYRHRALSWAARLARERAWRMRIHGRGWESHPELAEFAAGGPLDHGEELRACYRAARAHIHASISAVQHQRPLECFLSGGLCLLRLRPDDLGLIVTHMVGELAASGRSRFSALNTQGMGFLTVDEPLLTAHAALRQRLGLEARHVEVIPRDRAQDPWLETGGRPIDHEAAWVFGDLAEIGFMSESKLRERLTWAVERDEWRANIIRGVAARTRRWWTSERFAIDMLGRLAEPPTAARA
jgi:hypothetical protein